MDMKKFFTVTRLLEVILGVLVFIIALKIFSRSEALNAGWIILMGLITAAGVWVIDGDLKLRSKKLAFISIGFALSYPLGYIVQLFAAWVFLILKVILRILSIKYVLYAVIVGTIALGIYLVAKKYD